MTSTKVIRMLSPLDINSPTHASLLSHDAVHVRRVAFAEEGNRASSYASNTSIFRSYHNGIQCSLEPQNIYFFGMIDILQVNNTTALHRILGLYERLARLGDLCFDFLSVVVLVPTRNSGTR